MKRRIKNLLLHSYLPGKILYFILLVLWRGYQILTSGRYRSEFIGRRLPGKEQRQVSTYTKDNRYPFLFEQCSEYLKKQKQVKILSFGCSTGDEVFSLANYMPHATIVGTDINRWCIRQCKKRNADKKRLIFLHGNSEAFGKEKDFDAIFCMAVFQRTENRSEGLKEAFDQYRFQQFEADIAFLDKKLKAGGIFVIDHSDFRFSDTTIAKRYVPSDFEGNMTQRKRPLFDKYNQRVAETQCEFRMYIKKEED